MNRSADWLHQAHSDIDLAAVCAACHQAEEKALKALHLHHGQPLHPRELTLPPIQADLKTRGKMRQHKFLIVSKKFALKQRI